MKDNISPEEKLLRLIKGQKKQTGILDTKPATVSKKILTFFSLQKYLSFFDLRKVILGTFALSCIYLIILLIYPWFGSKKIKLPRITEKKIVETKSEVKPEVKPLEFYQQGVGNRQIFGNAAGQENAMPASAANADMIKDINLVGIISGANPQAVIEDKKTQKTYYVVKGQFIGEMQVEDIQEGKIIINYRGQKYELYL